MNKGLKKVLSYTLITTMVASMALTGFGGGARTVNAAGESYITSEPSDSASLVNFSTILGRAVDFGITADTYHQTAHSETNMAVKKYENVGNNNDPDLCGVESLPYIIGDITVGKLAIDKTFRGPDANDPQDMILNIETNPDVYLNSITQNAMDVGAQGSISEGFIDFRNTDGGKASEPDTSGTYAGYYSYGKFHVSFRSVAKENIENNVGLMIKHTQDESAKLAGTEKWQDLATVSFDNVKTNIDITQYETDKGITSSSNYLLDLSGYGSKVVYVAVPTNSYLYSALGTTNSLSISKDPGTIVVFNVPGTTVKIVSFNVNGLNSKQDDSGHATQNNTDIDSNICQTIVWNLYQAESAELWTVAGTILMPQENSNVTIGGSSAGWIASAGKVTSDAEFHYIYRGRSQTVSSNANGAIHFAARKDIYSSVDANGKPIERNDIQVGAGDFTFELYETLADYDISGKAPISTATNDSHSKIIFSDLEFGADKDNLGDHYYVIKEKDAGQKVNGITINDGEIHIKLTAYEDTLKDLNNDPIYDENNNPIKVVLFNVEKWHYLTSDPASLFKQTSSPDKVSSNEYTLGGIYNQYMEGGSLTITKTIDGDLAYADQNTNFTVALTGVNSDSTPLSGTYTATGLLSGDSVTFDASGEATVTIRHGGSITINNLPAGAKVTVAETNIPSYFAFNSTSSSSNLSPTISEGANSTVDLVNTYSVPEDGCLKLTKTIAGIDTIPNGYTITFTISKPDASTIQKVWPNDFNVDETGKSGYVELSGLKYGQYSVSESVTPTNPGITGYALAVSGTTSVYVGSSNKSAATAAQLSLTNTYTRLETVTVQKVVNGPTLPNGFKITNSYNNTEFTVDNANPGEDGTTAHPYTWTIANVPSGTSITFTESGYDRAGYSEKIYNNTTTTTSQYEVAGGAQTVTVSSTAANLCTFYNVYTRDTVELTATKVWDDNNNADGKRPNDLVMTLSDGTTNVGNVTLNNANSWTGSLVVPECDENGNPITYTWTEANVPNYALTSTSTTGNTTTFTNVYPIPGYATFNISKVFSIPTGYTGNAFDGKKFSVQIHDPVDPANPNAVLKYYDANGTIVSPTAPASRIEISGTPVAIKLPIGGTYVVEEIDSAVSGFTCETTYTVGSANTQTLDFSSMTASADTDDVTVTNTYTGIGSLQVTKKLDTTGDTPTSTDSFTINVSFDTAGKYTVEQHIDAGVTSSPVDFEANTVQSFTLAKDEYFQISNIPAGVGYTVTEGTLPTDYTLTSITDNGTGTIAQGTTKAIVVLNKYTAPAQQPTTGYLDIKKVLGANSPAEASNKDYSFTITQTVGSGFTTENFTIKAGATKSYTSIPFGTYTITEDTNAAKIDGYSLVAENSGSTIEVTSANTDTNHATFTVTNTYTQNQPTPASTDVVISKREEGKTEELANASLKLTKDGVTAPLSTWPSGSSPVTINSLGVGTYTLTEVAAPDGYKTASPISFTIEDDGNGNLVVKRDGQVITDKTIIMYDSKLPTKEVSFSKVDAYNSGEIAGAELTLYKYVGGVQSTVTNWTSSETEVYKFTIGAGDYGIEETVAPSGYEKASSLVRFTLTFDANGNAAIVVSKGPGVYDATNDVIKIKDDPIRVTGKLSVHVEEKKTGRPVPDAEVEVTGPDGTTTTYKTNGNGEIVDVNGNTPIDVPAGKYKVTVKKVPAGYEVETGQTAEVEVPENKEGRHIAKIVSSTGGLKIKVLEEGTNREVPDATVVVEAPEGVKFPDGSTKITAVTDKNGNITTYTGADGKTYDLTSGLTPGDYKITVTKVPAGYQVTTGETKTKKVVKDEVAEHVALIATSSSVKPAPAPAPAPAATPAATPATPTGSITNSINVKTGDDMNVYPALIAMALSLITGVSVVAFRRKRETK